MSLYDILNIPKNSTKFEIEKAYKKIAKKVHPVVCKTGDAQFVELNRAYSILKDDYKRDFYDMFGDNSINLLNRDKDSFITVRLFDRINILCYTLFVIGLVSNLILIPLAMYYDLLKYANYVFSGLNIFLVIPLIRNIFRLDYSAIKQISYFSLRYFTLSNYFLVENIFGIIILICVDIINIFCMIEQYCRQIFISFYIPFIINLLFVIDLKYIPWKQLSVILAFIILNAYLLIKEIRPLFIVLSPSLLFYFLPMILISFGIRNKLIFIPTAILMMGSCVGLIALFKWLINNIPSYKPTHKSLESPV